MAETKSARGSQCISLHPHMTHLKISKTKHSEGSSVKVQGLSEEEGDSTRIWNMLAKPPTTVRLVQSGEWSPGLGKLLEDPEG